VSKNNANSIKKRLALRAVEDKAAIGENIFHLKGRHSKPYWLDN
jgi:hypothetical protein